LSLLVREQDGTRVVDDTGVEVVATNGDLCALPDSLPVGFVCSGWHGILALKTRNGVASAFVRSSTAPGAITLNVHSGSVTATTSVTASARTAPEGGKIVLQADKDTISVGHTDRLLLFVTTSDGTQAADGTRVVVSVPDHALSKKIVVTRDGFAETMLTGAKSGNALVTAQSGSAKGQTTIVVK
jgi:hypothetical protein